jgi:hypothetical protein
MLWEIDNAQMLQEGVRPCECPWFKKKKRSIVYFQAIIRLWDSPSSQVNQGGPRTNARRDVIAMGVKQCNFVVCLVELFGPHNFIPNGQADVIVKELIWQCRLIIRIVSVPQDLCELIANTTIHALASNVHNLAMFGSSVRRHDANKRDPHKNAGRWSPGGEKTLKKFQANCEITPA